MHCFTLYCGLGHSQITSLHDWADVSPKVESDSSFPAFFFFFCGILHSLHRRSQNRLTSENRMGEPELSLHCWMLCKWSLTVRLAFCSFTFLPSVCLVFGCLFDGKRLKKKNLFYWKTKANSNVDIFCVFLFMKEFTLCNDTIYTVHFISWFSIFFSLCMNFTHFTSTKLKT